MSIHYLAAVAKLTGVTPTCKLILFGLAFEASAHGIVVLSNAELCRITGLSERGLRGAMRRLEANSFVSVTRLAPPSTPIYHLLFER